MQQFRRVVVVILAVFFSNDNTIVHGVGSSNSSRSTAEVHKQLSPFCLPFAFSLGDLCSAIASRLEGLSKSTLCIHIAIKSTSFMSILNKKVPQSSTSASSADGKKAPVGERRQQVIAFNLCEKGSFSAVAKNSLFPWLMSSKGIVAIAL